MNLAVVRKAPDRLLGRVLRAIYLRYIESRPPVVPFFTQDDPAYNQWKIGVGTYGKPRVLHTEDSVLVVGRYCSIANDVVILLGGEHHAKWITTYPFYQYHPEAKLGEQFGFPMSKGNVVIGNDVWIGHGALILSGVKIGDGAIIAAGSVVARCVGPYEVVGGVPARTIRYRFPPDRIRQLCKIAWWEWPLEAIRDAWPLLLSDDLEAFLARYGGGGDGVIYSPEEEDLRSRIDELSRDDASIR